MIQIIAAILSMAGSWMVYKKMGRQGWEGIVPIYNTYVLCQELYGNGWKFLLLLIPFYVTTARLSQISLKKSRPAVLRKVSGAKAQNLICA